MADYVARSRPWCAACWSIAPFRLCPSTPTCCTFHIPQAVPKLLKSQGLKTRSPQNHYPHPNVFLASCPSCQQPLIPTCEPAASISSPPACPAPGGACICPPHARLPPNRPRCTSCSVLCSQRLPWFLPSPTALPFAPIFPVGDFSPISPDGMARSPHHSVKHQEPSPPSPLPRAPRSHDRHPPHRPPPPAVLPDRHVQVQVAPYCCALRTFRSVPPNSSSVLLRAADHFHDAVPGAVGAGHGVRERAHDLCALGTGTTGCLPHPSICEEVRIPEVQASSA
jgi:hypothetical protein